MAVNIPIPQPGGTTSRGSGSSAGEGTAHPRNLGAPQGGAPAWFSEKLRAQVLSARYLGRDKNGNPMYRLVYRVTSGPTMGRTGGKDQLTATRVRTVATQGGNIVTPLLKGKADVAGSGSTPGQAADLHLQRAKDAWLTWIASNSGVTLTPNQVTSLTKFVQNFQGSYLELNKRMKFIEANNPVGPGGVVGDDGQAPGDGFDPFAGIGSGGGGGGGGFSGPEYVAPDRRVVEDMAKGMLISLVGAEDEGFIQKLADIYMTDHRRNFDTPEREIDPAQSVLETIRDSQDYREIHFLRPESDDERSWVAQRRQAAAQGGLQTDRRQDFARGQATIGGDVADVADAAALTQLNESGSARGTLIEDKIRNTAQAMFVGAV